LVFKIEPLAPAVGVLQENDVLCEVESVPVADDGTIEFRNEERIQFSHIFKCKHIGKKSFKKFLILFSKNFRKFIEGHCGGFQQHANRWWQCLLWIPSFYWQPSISGSTGNNKGRHAPIPQRAIPQQPASHVGSSSECERISAPLFELLQFFGKSNPPPLPHTHITRPKNSGNARSLSGATLHRRRSDQPEDPARRRGADGEL
jgi:hypothetical protein